MALPEWICNHSVGVTCEWVCIPYRVAPPAALPQHLQGHGCLLQQTDAEEDVVKASLRSGIMLTKDQLHSLWQVAKFKLPEAKKGSGRNGNIIKIDYCRAALDHFFPDASPEQYDHMMNSLMGCVPSPVCQQDVLDAVKALDPLAQQDFEDMKQYAKNQLHSQSQKKPVSERAKKKERPEPQAVPEPVVRPDDEPMPPRPEPPRKRPAEEVEAQPPASPAKARAVKPPEQYTPQSLHDLIPGRGDLAGVYIKRLPGGPSGKVYQGFYPASSSVVDGREAAE